MTVLLPRARLRDVVMRRSHLLGSRLNPDEIRGVFSPIEARVCMGLEYDDLLAEEARLLRERKTRRRVGMLIRAVLARLLGGARTAHKSVRIFGVEPACLCVPDAVDFVFASEETRARIIHFAHPHALNVSLIDDELWGDLRKADAVFGDGIGVRIGTRLLGGALPSNLNGTDMLPLICRRAAADARPIVLVGARSEIVQECAERLRFAHPGLSIPIISHGYLSDEQSLQLAEKIGLLQRPIVLVGMGTPIQERWVWRYLSHIEGSTVLTVGGLFDFYSGRISRAPVAMRELGLEWLYRLWKEPRRMARRYLFGNPFFLGMTLLQRVGLGPRRLAKLPGLAWLLGSKRRTVAGAATASNHTNTAIRSDDNERTAA